ncbi:MAG TPA: hypothetical protein VKX17_03165 [Planctomycetota bacterium]|nr:hypothetical protein [Planctomycetota bacterium]
MKLIPRFSLRTLRLVCLLCGAAEGVWLKRQVWLLGFAMPMPEPELPFSNLSTITFDNSEKRTDEEKLGALS